MNSRLHICKAGTLALEPHSSPFCSGHFGDGGLVKYLPGLTSNRDLPIDASS
jgi:hypothetical protein